MKYYDLSKIELKDIGRPECFAETLSDYDQCVGCLWLTECKVMSSHKSDEIVDPSCDQSAGKEEQSK